MAVYTHINEAELTAFLAPFGLGAIVGFDGIAAGVENPNYSVRTRDPNGGEDRKTIVTIFERRVREDDVPFFLDAMAHFSGCGLPTPIPLADPCGRRVFALQGKPAIAVTFLDGAPRMDPAPKDCFAFGRTLARMHRVAVSFRGERKNDLSVDGWRALAAACASSDGDRNLVDMAMREVAAAAQAWPDDLPRGLIHADAFPDNVFFSPLPLLRGISPYAPCRWRRRPQCLTSCEARRCGSC